MIYEFEDIMGERRMQPRMNLLVECPTADCECPYWSWKYHKCAMMVRGEGDPRKECDNYWDDEDEGDDIQGCLRESLGNNWW